MLQKRRSILWIAKESMNTTWKEDSNHLGDVLKVVKGKDQLRDPEGCLIILAGNAMSLVSDIIAVSSDEQMSRTATGCPVYKRYNVVYCFWIYQDVLTRRIQPTCTCGQEFITVINNNNKEEWKKWHFCYSTLFRLTVFPVAFGHLYESYWSQSQWKSKPGCINKLWACLWWSYTAFA